jgi:hypothetical protein
MEQTKDYAIFKTVEGNRPINPKHVETLKAAIQQSNLLDICPIVVDKDFAVIDGQHRLAAAKELGIPVWYRQDISLDIASLITLNANQQKWTAGDYVNYYAARGNPDYLRFKRCMMAINVDVRALLATISRLVGGSFYRHLKSGTFKFSETTAADTVLLQMKVKDLVDAIKECKTGDSSYFYRTHYWKAFAHTMRHPQIDQGELKRRLCERANYLTRCYSYQDALELIQNVYNYKKREKVNLQKIPTHDDWEG